MCEDEKLKLECLRLAAGGGHYKHVVEKAQAFYDFVQSTKDGEIISAARELVKKVSDNG